MRLESGSVGRDLPMGDTCETVTLSVAGMAKRSLISAVTAASCPWPCMPSSAAKSLFVPLKTKWHLAVRRVAKSGPVDLADPLGGERGVCSCVGSLPLTTWAHVCGVPGLIRASRAVTRLSVA